MKPTCCGRLGVPGNQNFLYPFTKGRISKTCDRDSRAFGKQDAAMLLHDYLGWVPATRSGGSSAKEAETRSVEAELDGQTDSEPQGEDGKMGAPEEQGDKAGDACDEVAVGDGGKFVDTRENFVVQRFVRRSPPDIPVPLFVS